MFFIPYDNWQTYFFIKAYTEAIFYHHAHAFFETRDLKEVCVLFFFSWMTVHTKTNIPKWTFRLSWSSRILVTFLNCFQFWCSFDIVLCSWNFSKKTQNLFGNKFFYKMIFVFVQMVYVKREQEALFKSSLVGENKITEHLVLLIQTIITQVLNESSPKVTSEKNNDHAQRMHKTQFCSSFNIYVIRFTKKRQRK